MIWPRVLFSSESRDEALQAAHRLTAIYGQRMHVGFVYLWYPEIERYSLLRWEVRAASAVAALAEDPNFTGRIES